MKKLLTHRLLILFVILGLSANIVYGQYYNGPTIDVDRLAKSFYSSAFKSICEDMIFKKDYKQLYKFCHNDIYKQKNKTPLAYFYLGSCYELGMGCKSDREKAKALYQKGSKLGNKECKQRLKQIKSKGWKKATKDNRAAFARRYGKPSVTPSPSPRPGQDTYKCSSCNGSGICRHCNGSGRTRNRYNGYVYDCAVCNGSGNCAQCHGTGRL